ncbi:General substrate transporter [Macrophomina phaseolina MS6]|uniref:General substrate transporter n=1 Tax=Macrophomina phaseolina (strain MS6) TaxID=1126212 RepID=K2S6T1_MACPH|nr:General substrate transporter [Macrophomina phaseolina MS6]
MLGIGALAASWISYGTYIGYAEDDNRQWRVSLGIQVIPAGLLAMLILFFPESPRWLIDHGQPDKGLETLAQLHAHGDVNDAWVRAEFDQIQDAISVEHEHEAKSYTELFTDKSCFRRLFIAISLQASVQMTGVSAIQYYSVDIYKQIGIAGDDTLKYQAINSVIALVAQLLTILFIDKTGRRWPLIFGNLGNMVCFIIATALLAVFPPGATGNGAASWGFIAMTWLYNFSFSCTCGPLSWISRQPLVPAEIFDTRTRSKGVAIATMTSFAFNTMIGQVTPIALTNIGWKYYILFVVSPRNHNKKNSGTMLIRFSLPGLQLHQRRLLLGHPARDQAAPARRDELPLHQRSAFRPDHGPLRLRATRPGAQGGGGRAQGKHRTTSRGSEDMKQRISYIVEVRMMYASAAWDLCPGMRRT